MVAILEAVICQFKTIWRCKWPLSPAGRVVFHASSKLKKLNNKKVKKNKHYGASCNFSRG